MILYKKDTKGKTRYLEIKTEGPDLVQISGVVGTDNPVEHRKTCKGKNVGKSNETTSTEQALLEMNSKLKDKLTEGYFKTQDEAETVEVILPMLAKDYKSESHKIDWSGNVFIQPKLDGMRCLAFISNGKVTLMSRTGKVIENMQHIEQSLSGITADVILDGELYAHGRSFQENMELIKKYRKGETESIHFHIYDMVSTLPFNQRKVRPFVEITLYTEEVSTYQIKNEEELTKWHLYFLEKGYEGSILRHGDEPYKVNGRSSNLLKYKDFIDIACTIVDIEPAEQRPEHGVPVLEHEGKRFRAGMKYSHDERKEFLENKNNYIGKTAEIRFFEYTDEGIPRFPVMVGVRLDK